MEDIQPGSHYRHFKGMCYRVLKIARHSETLDEYVVYEALYDNPLGTIWVRPRAMFEEEIERDGRKVRRFARIDEGAPLDA